MEELLFFPTHLLCMDFYFFSSQTQSPMQGDFPSWEVFSGKHLGPVCMQRWMGTIDPVFCRVYFSYFILKVALWPDCIQVSAFVSSNSEGYRILRRSSYIFCLSFPPPPGVSVL
jgi:hypothetical protein